MIIRQIKLYKQGHFTERFLQCSYQKFLYGQLEGGYLWLQLRAFVNCNGTSYHRTRHFTRTTESRLGRYKHIRYILQGERERERERKSKYYISDKNEAIDTMEHISCL